VILVDTSVWVEVFKRKKPLNLDALVDFDDIVVCLPVVQEVLQGFKDEGAYRVARRSLLSFPMLEAPLGQPVFERAVDLYRSARRRGLTVRSATDCLIGAVALEHNAEVLHRDRDYGTLATVSPLRHRALG
jgi:predicted nucleic acid-binding protein